MGIIVRTAAADHGSAKSIATSTTLLRLWMGIQERAAKTVAPALIYEESDFVIRVIRDLPTADVERILVDSEDTCEKILEFIRLLPHNRKMVERYDDRTPMPPSTTMEPQIEKITATACPCPGGGSLVIEQTRALVAIDELGAVQARSERRGHRLPHEHKAAVEIGRQIRLRDLGGLIIDFIDMRRVQARRGARPGPRSRTTARTKMLRMSRFCIIEMTRQRTRRNIEYTEYQTCPPARAADRSATS